MLSSLQAASNLRGNVRSAHGEISQLRIVYKTDIKQVWLSLCMYSGLML